MINLMRDPGRMGPFILAGLEEMCRNLPLRGVMYEVGSYAGESAEVFARFFAEVHCVDPWEGKLYHSEGDGEVEREFDRRTRGLRIVKHKGRSVDVAKGVADASLDFVYIDADHSLDAVLADLSAWLPKVRAGGVIGGHDFLPPDFQWTDVARAVERFFHGALPTVYPDTSWVMEIKG